MAIEVNPQDVEAARPFFDSEYYLAQNRDVAKAGVDPLAHYLVHGWREGRDPSSDFSTNYYLASNHDIRNAGINPFVHFCRYGRAEKREGAPYYRSLEGKFYPLVSVVVPNFNHAKFLPERFRSIFKQTYKNIELIVLDDCSSDDSIAVIQELTGGLKIPVKTCFNEQNSGNVFAQWQRGVEMADGEFIWICESDDTCEPEFLEHLIPSFVDRSVMLSFGDIQFCDANGNILPGMDSYRENAESGIWNGPIKRPARAWFAGAFGVNNVVANVGGCVFRKGTIKASVWETAKTYRIAGDWYLYSEILGGGQMCYVPSARTYFRQHAKNTSSSNFNKLYYYEELWRILEHNISMWGIPAKTRENFIGKVRFQYVHFGMEEEHGSFEEQFDISGIMARDRDQPHILIAFLGFHLGGGEVFSINLANELLKRGRKVSMLAFNMTEINPDMINNLDSRVPVFHFGDMHLRGRDEFIAAIGATLVHSHVINCDAAFFRGDRPPLAVPYVVTLHGSYDSVGREAYGMLFENLKNVSHWVYLADKNLKVFGGLPLDPSAVSKIRNAMPADPEPFPYTREELGIDQDAIVFTLVARCIQRKGWRAAVTAFRRLQAERPDINAHLVMCGSGELEGQVEADVADEPNISFLGYQNRINGIYRMTDCAVVPTRFAGESFPLCIIQALQEATPVLATDIGEISTMIEQDGVSAGILLEQQRNSEAFFDSVFHGMVEMADPEKRQQWRNNAAALGKLFDINAMVEAYEEVYARATDRHGRVLEFLRNAAAD